MSRVYLLINDPLVAGRMRGVIDSAAGLKTVGWATTLEQARAQLPTLAADVVLADLQLADGWVADFVDELANSGRYGWPKTLLARSRWTIRSCSPRWRAAPTAISCRASRPTC